MDRRNFFELLGMILLGAMTKPQVVTAQERTVAAARQKRIVVIGAGLAGLAAAQELQSHRHEIVVVQARDRIGGRIWPSTKWPDLPVDFGATWIRGVKGNPLTQLAQQGSRFASGQKNR